MDSLSYLATRLQSELAARRCSRRHYACGVPASRAVRARLRRVDGKLGGIDRFTTVADVIDHFLGEPALSPTRINSSL